MEIRDLGPEKQAYLHDRTRTDQKFMDVVVLQTKRHYGSVIVPGSLYGLQNNNGPRWIVRDRNRFIILGPNEAPGE